MGRISLGIRLVAQTAFKLSALTGLILALGSACWGGRAEASPACNAADRSQVRLRISVSGIRSADGTVVITIYPDDAPHFLDGAYKVARQVLPVTLPVTQACFVVNAPAYYAVALFHDNNNSGRFETTRLGLPAKGYGFSNNPTLYFGPPDLSQVRFQAHSGDNPVSVRMEYWH